jgi:hypothetical protein
VEGLVDHANPFGDFHQPSILMRYIGLMKKGKKHFGKLVCKINSIVLKLG